MWSTNTEHPLVLGIVPPQDNSIPGPGIRPKGGTRTTFSSLRNQASIGSHPARISTRHNVVSRSGWSYSGDCSMNRQSKIDLDESVACRSNEHRRELMADPERGGPSSTTSTATCPLSDDVRAPTESQHSSHKEELVLQDPKELASRHEQRLEYCMRELLETEENYVKGLEYAVQELIPLFSSDAVPPAVRAASSKIFSNIGEIYHFHKSAILPELRNCPKDVDLIAELFLVNNSGFCVYESYCQNKPIADELLVELGAQVLQVQQSILAGSRLQLNDYLMSPIQRLTKYVLLIKEIEKLAVKADLDNSVIQEARDCMEKKVKTINDRTNVGLIRGYSNDLDELGELHLQDKLLVSLERGLSSRPMQVFLFEMGIVLTSHFEQEGRLPVFQFEAVMLRQAVNLAKTHVKDNPCQFVVIDQKYSYNRIYFFEAETEEKKDTWISHLSVYNHHSQSSMSSKGSLNCHPMLRTMNMKLRLAIDLYRRQCEEALMQINSSRMEVSATGRLGTNMQHDDRYNTQDLPKTLFEQEEDEPEACSIAPGKSRM